MTDRDEGRTHTLHEARKRIKSIEGEGPGGKLNWAYMDGYAVKALERDYGMSYDDLKKKVEEHFG